MRHLVAVINQTPLCCSFHLSDSVLLKYWLTMLQKTVIKIKLTKGLIVVIIDTSIKFSLTDVSECAQSGLCLYDSIIIIVRFCLERLRHS